MDTPVILTLIISILGSSLLTAVVTSFINRKKTEAETKQITVSSEIELSGATLNYAKEVKNMFDSLRNDYNKLKEEHDNLKEDYDELKAKTASLEAKYVKVIEFLGNLGYDESEII